VGFDIKTKFENYEKITQIPDSGKQALKSFLTLVRSKVNFEVRTTYDPKFITDNDMIDIARFLVENKIKKWIIQECVLRHDSKINERLDLPSKDLMAKLIEIIDVEIRK
jgi:pyruvate formate lyase activating enzyme